MKILYLHGYGSKFDESSDKIQTLGQLGPVSGPDLDYGKGQQAVFDEVVKFVGDDKCDLVVGTSMGGWLASHASVLLDVPFVALNPAVRPSQTLKKYIGQTINYVGHDCRIDGDAVASYDDFQIKGDRGHILCEEVDDVLDARATIEYLKEFYGTDLIPGGSHRFESLADHLAQLELVATSEEVGHGSEAND